jgi:hypothetical protein
MIFEINSKVSDGIKTPKVSVRFFDGLFVKSLNIQTHIQENYPLPNL